ncbi:MAG: hypothetical protein NTY35_10300 [Planctomycetota bacterium]|nr:hypothetical protein [Planctomycetota bacterium]
MPNAFVARQPWDPTRPQVLVVCCSDGRFHAPIVEFVDNQVSDRADMLAVPGGPAILDPWNSSFDEARVFESALRLFLEHHDLRQAWLIAHENCSYYRIKHPGLDPRALEQRQRQDLRRGAEVLRERAARLEPQLRYARLVDGRVRFEEVEPGPSTESLVLS